MRGKYFLTTFICLNLLIWIGMTSVYSASIREEDLEIKISPYLDNLTILQGTALSFEVFWVNNAAVRQSIIIQNQQSYGKEIKEEIARVKLSTPTWKWDDNLKIKVAKISEELFSKKIVREEKLTNINWRDYYVFANKESEIELIGSESNVRRSWCIPPDITVKLESGRYEIIATHDSRDVPDKNIFHGLLISKPIIIYIKKPVTNREKAIVLLNQAKYYGDIFRFGKKYFNKRITLAKEALRLDPTYYQAHESLAFSYWWGTGELEKAVEEFEIYLEEYLKDPTIPVAECGGKDYEEYRIKRFIKEIKEVLKKRTDKVED
ncbi:MAG: hypothetical protein AB1422_17235 [bacterium]